MLLQSLIQPLVGHCTKLWQISAIGCKTLHSVYSQPANLLFFSPLELWRAVGAAFVYAARCACTVWQG
eukprot:5764907-Karenia_brevis.AAC.1